MPSGKKRNCCMGSRIKTGNVGRLYFIIKICDLLLLLIAVQMEWKKEMTLVLYLLVVMATAAWASSKEIAQELMDRCETVS